MARTPRADKAQACACGSTRSYEVCCGKWHAGTPAPTAEMLMRSRYTAFVLKNENYLLATWHSSTRPASIEFDPNLKWLQLDVIEATEDDPAHAQVEFVARFRIGGGSAARHHERSQFVRENDRWFYVAGELRGQNQVKTD